jgi:cyclopropane fatty-acyl-phospholipid synthase-like methyltransferase
MDRFAWAAETLAVEPSDKILEIGCGHGLAVPLVAAKLKPGGLLAIDRSAKMIALAAKRNSALVKSGTVAFETATLEDFAIRRRRFSKIFAVNVNLFWTDPAAGLPLVVGWLQPRGRLYLFYQPPSGAMIDRIAGILSRNLKQYGFTHLRALIKGARMLCVMADRPTKKVP